MEIIYPTCMCECSWFMYSLPFFLLLTCVGFPFTDISSPMLKLLQVTSDSV